MLTNNKNAFGEPDYTETRYTGLVDQIDALLWLEHDNGRLSQAQLEQLADLRNQIEVYGERAEKWVKLCDRALAGKPVSAKYESMMGFPDNTETRYSGLVDQIDALLWLEHDNGSLSQEQLDQLADLRNQIEVYGERAEGWVKSCDRALAGKPVSAKYESMMGFYTKFVNSFDCPQVLAEAATKLFKEVLVEASQSSTVAEQLRQRVGVNPHEAQGVNVFGISGDDGLPQEATVDKEISDAMVSGSFDALGDDIATTDPNGFDETAMGLGSSELDTSGNDLNPDDWAATEDETATGEQPAPEASTEPVDGDDGDDMDSAFEAAENPVQECADAKIKRYLASGGEKAADTVQMLLLGDSYEDCRLSMFTARQYLFDHKHLLGDDVSDSDVPALPFARRTIYELVDSVDGPEKASMLSDIVDFAASHDSMDELEALEKYLD